MTYTLIGRWLAVAFALAFNCQTVYALPAKTLVRRS